MTLRNFALSALLLAFPSVAQALTLECSITPSNAGGGYVTDLYVLQYDEASGQAIVSDGLIMYYNNEQPMKAKVSDDTASKLVLTWNVQMTNSTGQMTKMQFRASYFKGNKSITVRAVPGGGYVNNFEGRGKCKAV
jgi:hypothetical protein